MPVVKPMQDKWGYYIYCDASNQYWYYFEAPNNMDHRVRRPVLTELEMLLADLYD